MGYGAGSGEGMAPAVAATNGPATTTTPTTPVTAPATAPATTAANMVNGTETAATRPTTVGYGSGGGGGGGGVGIGRPVAAIIINRDGVRVEPIIDLTKVALAFITMLGSMFFMTSRMRRAARELESKK
jgi:hypothetical protein